MNDRTPAGTNPADAGPAHPPVGGTRRTASSLHRFAPYRSGPIDVESVVSGCTLIGMMCLVVVLFAAVVDLGGIA